MAQSATDSGANQHHLDLLNQVPFLANAPAEELEKLAESTVLRRHRPNETITRQGDFGHSMFIIVSGAVAIHAVRSDGAQLALETLHRPGDFFGEEALLGRGERSATAVSQVETVLLEVEQRRFALLARRHQPAMPTLRELFHQRFISTFLRMHPFLSRLGPELTAQLSSSARMDTFERNDFPCRQGDVAHEVMLIADGVLKAVRKSPDGRLSVLAYFNTGEVVGAHDPAQRPYDLTAMGKCQVIFFPKQLFDSLEFSAPEIYARFGKDRMSRQGAMENAGQTIFGSAEALFQEGIEVESLLIIDLDRCVRCGSCVRACHTRHKFSRLERRGPIFRRRKSLQSTQHQHLLIPSSCRHCRDPECMIGCPTGAIQRHPNGEVEINNNCVGCDNCARKCPYGNITMRPIPEKEQVEGGPKRVAIKCNLCRGYNYANCVHECPRGALLRVNPMEYFDELGVVLAADQDQEHRGNKSQRQLANRSTRPVTMLVISTLLLLFGSIGISAAYLQAPHPYSASTPMGLAFGGVGAGCIVAALMLGARKKLANHGLGAREAWTQFHMVLGALGLVAALAHSNFSITGVFSTLLMFLFVAEVLTGVAGQLLYSRVPKILTRLEKHGNSKLIEDLFEEREQLHQGIQEIEMKANPALRKMGAMLKRMAGTTRMRLKKHYDGPSHLAQLRSQLVLPPQLVNERATAERLLSDYHKLADLQAQIRLHRVLKQWLYVHLAISAALAVFLAMHVAVLLPLVLR